MRDIYIFSIKNQKASKKFISLVGGKGASLGELIKNKIPVPPAFIISTKVFQDFIKSNNIKNKIEKQLKLIDINKEKTIDNASAKIQKLIINGKFSSEEKRAVLREYDRLKTKFVAVRSSASAEDSDVDSWGGQLESYLNVTKKLLEKYIKECWASLFSSRALTYRFNRDLLDKDIGVAIVVQKMIQAKASGVVFTVAPVTNDSERMIIEAGFGLGEAIVGGIITPDSYIIDKTKNKIINKRIAVQKIMIVKDKDGDIADIPVAREKQEIQKIPDSIILKIAKVCLKIEKYYNKPQDIEWAYDGKNIFITQSRPITTL